MVLVGVCKLCPVSCCGACASLLFLAVSFLWSHLSDVACPWRCGAPLWVGWVCLGPGGDPEKFKKAQQAYEVLKNPEKRKLYDQGGLEAVERGEARGATRRQRTRDVVRPLPCKLEDLYNGRTRKFAVHRTVLCKTCTGSGCKAGKSEVHCTSCRGRGVKVIVRRMGPMIQQMQVACDECRGEGTSIAPEDKCPACNGQKLAPKRERKTVEVAIEKGMKDNQKITLRGACVFVRARACVGAWVRGCVGAYATRVCGMSCAHFVPHIVCSGIADEEPGKDPGDLVFVLQVAKHPLFRRRGADLYMDKDITLLQALTGVEFVLEHMDGASLLCQQSHITRACGPGHDRVTLVLRLLMQVSSMSSRPSPERLLAWTRSRLFATWACPSVMSTSPRATCSSSSTSPSPQMAPCPPSRWLCSRPLSLAPRRRHPWWMRTWRRCTWPP